MKIFGYELKRWSKDEHLEAGVESFAPPEDLAAITSDENFGTTGVFNITPMQHAHGGVSDAELVFTYRTMAQHPVIDECLHDIVNQAVVLGGDSPPIALDLDHVNASDETKAKITKEFNEILRLMKFSTHGNDLFRRFYIDGRLIFHKIINPERPQDGIHDLRRIEPHHLERRVLNKKQTNSQGQIEYIGAPVIFYVYNRRDLMTSEHQRANATDQYVHTSQPVVISEDAIAWGSSGLTDAASGLTLSYLHKSIRVLNHLTTLEDDLIVYFHVRAPERRIFYVDTGNMSRMKEEEYLKRFAAKLKNKIFYDAKTGKVKSTAKHNSILEDYYIPRRGSGSGTEVSTLSGGNNLLNFQENLEYFKVALYRALNIPPGRMQSDGVMGLGRPTEITRDEVKFQKFIELVRSRFNDLVLDILKTQCVLKKLMNPDDFEVMRYTMAFKYASDVFFAELKESELLLNRLQAANDSKEYVGLYISHKYVRKQIFRQTDDEIVSENEQIEKEKHDPHYAEDEEDDDDSRYG